MADKTFGIDEITAKTKISLLAIGKNNSQIEVPITLAELHESEKEEVESVLNNYYIPLDVVRQEWEDREVMISFQKANAMIHLLAVHENQVYAWMNVKIELFQLHNGKKLHLLLVRAKMGEHYNRRKGVRISLLMNMDVVQDDIHHSILVKDVSYCGIGLLERANSNINPKSKKPLIITIVNPRNGKPMKKIKATIVRQDRNEHDEIITGCVIDAKSHGFMQTYVSQIQMDRAKVTSSKGGYDRRHKGANWKDKLAEGLEEISAEKKDENNK